MFDEHTVLESYYGEQNIIFHQKENDSILDYNDKNADRIGNCRFSLKK
jgi:hypothetical protein